MPSKPTIQYNVKAGRWEIRGSRGTLKAIVSELAQPVIGPIWFVGSSPALAATGSVQTTGTISGAAGIKRTDFVLAIPRAKDTNNIVSNVAVPSDGLITFTASAIVAASSYPAMSWDVLAFRRTA